MNKYIVKNQNNKQNKNVFGMTDYDIPMFGFKSALLILVSTMLSLYHLCQWIHLSPHRLQTP